MADGTPQSTDSSAGMGVALLGVIALVALLVASYSAVQSKRQQEQLRVLSERVEALSSPASGDARTGWPDRSDRSDRSDRRVRPGAPGGQGADAVPAPGAQLPGPPAQPAAAPPAPAPLASAPPRPNPEQVAEASRRDEAEGARLAREIVTTLGVDKETAGKVLEQLGREGRGRSQVTEAFAKGALTTLQAGEARRQLRARADAAVKELLDAASWDRYQTMRASWEAARKTDP